MPTDGYMDAAAIGTPDGDDGLREQVGRALEGHQLDHGARCHCDGQWRPDDYQARHQADALLPLIRDRIAAVQAERERADGSTSDGYHTFDELYEFRMLYNAHAANGWQAAGIPVVKSWRHSDGDLCFGGGWFVVVATLPTGQVSNHYEVNYWDLFRVPEVELPPEWDGHTSDDVVARLRAELYRTEADDDH